MPRRDFVESSHAQVEAQAAAAFIATFAAEGVKVRRNGPHDVDTTAPNLWHTELATRWDEWVGNKAQADAVFRELKKVVVPWETFQWFDINLEESKGKRYWLNGNHFCNCRNCSDLVCTSPEIKTTHYAIFRRDFLRMGVVLHENIVPYIFPENRWSLDNRFQDGEGFYKLPYGIFSWYDISAGAPRLIDPVASLAALPESPGHFVLKLCGKPGGREKNFRLRDVDRYDAFVDKVTASDFASYP